MGKSPTLNTNRIIYQGHTPEFDDIRFGVMMLVDKPLEWTSFDVVNKIRSALKYGPGIKKIKVGHAGTLDPLASGLLLVCIGKYTKLIDSLTVKDKTYLATIKIGATTQTYDREAQEENIKSIDHISKTEIHSICKEFLGEQQQIPPIYSAIKVDGKSAHRLARKGKDFVLKSRKIIISNLNILNWESPFITVSITCSKGTYIRSLAHDIGEKLGVGGYLYGLKRTSIDKYDLKDGLSMEECINWINGLPIAQKELANH